MKLKSIITIILLSIICLNTNAQLAEDYSFQRDKQYHSIAGSIVGASTFILLNNKYNDANLSIRGTYIITMGVGLGKEIFDMTNTGDLSLADIGYTTLSGVLTAVILKGIIKLKNKKKRRRRKLSYYDL